MAGVTAPVRPGSGDAPTSIRGVGALSVLAALAALIGAYLGLLVLQPVSARATTQASDVLTFLAALGAALACGRAARRNEPAVAPFWWLLTAACAAWALGEATWSWYEVVLRIGVPQPSLADPFYLAGTPLAVGAFLVHPAARRRDIWSALPLLDALGVAAAVLLAGEMFVLGPMVARGNPFDLGNLVALAYPVGDVVVLVLVVLALQGMPAGRRAGTGLLLGGLLVMAVTDALYTFLLQNDQYNSGNVVDTGWFAAYLAIAAAGLVAREQAPADVPLANELLRLAAPYVPVLASLALVAGETVRGVGLSRVEQGLAVALAALVLTRQALFLLHRRLRPRRLPPPAPPAAVARPRLPSAALRAPGDRFAPAYAADSATTDAFAELHSLSLQIAAAARPDATERVQRISTSLVATLAATAGAMALLDLTLLLHATG